MDAKLRRELAAIARDNRSGAAELTLQGTDAILQWLDRAKKPAEAELLRLACVVIKAQPSMAPLLRLGNEIALALDSTNPQAHLVRRLTDLRRNLKESPRLIAGRFRRSLSRKRDVVVATYSYSSTVAACLRAARGSLHSVCCSEGRPAGEGFAMASTLARAGIRVSFSTDACLTGQMWPQQILLLGADAILPGCFAGKVGTKALVLHSQVRRCPVVVAVDTMKFWPNPRKRGLRWDWRFGPRAELWRSPPRNVDVYNLYFELTWITRRSRIRFLTEKGWMTPARVRRELKKIRISPRLKSLVD